MIQNISEYRRNLAWKAGVKAFEQGKPKSANNRHPCTIYYYDWSDGWNHAARAKGSAS